MLSNTTKLLYQNFIHDSELENLDKRSRVDRICKNINLNKIMKHVCKKSMATIETNVKCEAKAFNKLNSALFLYSSGKECLLKRAIKQLFQAIIFSSYGGETFVNSYHLRSKCHLQMSKFQEALYDVNVAIKYGGKNTERMFIKAMILYYQFDYIGLKEFLDTEPIDSNESDIIKHDIILPGYQTMATIKDLREFVNNGHLDQSSTDQPLCSARDEDDFSGLKPVLSFRSNYELDHRCKIVNDPKKGRHFMCTGYIPKGSKILVERAYSLVMDSKVQHKLCLYCNEYCDSRSLPCRFCTNAIFCNEQCFERAWSVFHSHECLIIPLFEDSMNSSLHMYRQIIKIGLQQALSIKQQFDRLKSNAKIEMKAKECGKSINQYVNDFIIEEYLDDKLLQKTADFQQSSDQKIKIYQVLQTLLDHNEKYETYYDVCYVGLAIDVAMLLMLDDYLYQKQNEHLPRDQHHPHWMLLDWKELKEMLKENRLCSAVDEFDIFNHSYEDFITLVQIILINIRKLSTNVFSWNRYSSHDGVLQKNLASCECLIGSFINHSCDPNVEWDFKNGCIVYTTLRDVNPGDEINNSYGPNTGVAFIERQTLLANNYYFNCRCQACKQEVNQHPDVLGCRQCGGPVVVIADSAIDSDCMHCWQTYLRPQYRMKRVKDKRAAFQTLLKHFLQDGQNLQLSLVDRLTSTFDYQVEYGNKLNQHLLKQMMAFCKFLFRFKQMDTINYYVGLLFDSNTGRCLYQTEDTVEAIQNTCLWLDMNQTINEARRRQRRRRSSLVSSMKNVSHDRKESLVLLSSISKSSICDELINHVQILIDKWLQSTKNLPSCNVDYDDHHENLQGEQQLSNQKESLAEMPKVELGYPDCLLNILTNRF